MVAYRLLLGGRILPMAHQTEAAHIHLPFVAEDEAGQTDLAIVLPNGTPLPANLRAYLAVLLHARAVALRNAMSLAAADTMLFDAQGDTGRLLVQASREARTQAGANLLAAVELLEHAAQREFTLHEYMAAWDGADLACRPAIEALMRIVTSARAERRAGSLPPEVYEPLERLHVRLVQMVEAASLRRDREW
jgi:hypothetical protein